MSPVFLLTPAKSPEGSIAPTTMSLMFGQRFAHILASLSVTEIPTSGKDLREAPASSAARQPVRHRAE